MLLACVPRQAWDLAVDICLSQLPTIIEEGTAFRVSPAYGRGPLPYPILPPSPATPPLPHCFSTHQAFPCGWWGRDMRICAHMCLCYPRIYQACLHVSVCVIFDYVFV